jgi:hypothetical protein
MQQGKILDYWKSYARDVCPLIFYYTAALVSNILGTRLSILRIQELAIKKYCRLAKAR